MDKLVRKVHKIAHHRNGVCGNPFDVVLFTGQDSQRMVAILFPEQLSCAVLDIDLLSKDVIEFAQNSWRGDQFEDELREAIRKERG